MLKYLVLEPIVLVLEKRSSLHHSSFDVNQCSDTLVAVATHSRWLLSTPAVQTSRYVLPHLYFQSRSGNHCLCTECCQCDPITPSGNIYKRTSGIRKCQWHI